MTLQPRLSFREILNDEDFRFVTVADTAGTEIVELQTRTDEDFFAFVAAPNRRYRVTVEGQGDTDTVLGLYDLPGLRLQDDSDDEGGGRNPRLVVETGPVFETLLFQVDLFGPLEPGDSGGDRGGGYDLTIEDLGPVAGAQPRPNGDVIGETAATSRFLDRDTLFSGARIQAGDRDAYTILLDADDAFDFSITRLDGNVTLRAELFAADGTRLANQQAASANQPLRFSFTPEETDFYTLVISQAPGTTGTGGYRVQYGEPLAQLDSVPDTIADAQLLLPGTASFSRIDTPGDRDFYEIPIESEFTYDLVITDTGSLDAELRLFDEIGQLILSNQDNFGQDPAITFALSGATSADTYYLEVSSQDGSTGSYRLGFSRTAEFRGPPLGRDQVGDTIEDASSFLSQGFQQNSRIDFIGDRDVYAINLDEGVSYFFDGLANDALFVDPALRLFNANEVRVGQNADRVGDVSPLLVFTPNSSGKFFLEVSGEADTIGGYATALGLEISGQAIVALIYEAALNRQADPSGLVYWIGIFEDGAPLRAIAREFLRSPEFLSTVGDPNELSDAELVRGLYENVLDRPADASGLAFWLGELNRPGTEAADLLLDFARSQENALNSDYVFFQDLGFDPFV
ncbi:MAG: DUF4214 domain-containing protein [Paracoccaceae bacterium]